MAIDNLKSLTANKRDYPEIIPPPLPEFYLSAEEYNKLLRTLQKLIDDYNLRIGTIGQGPGGSLPLIPSGDNTTEPTDNNLFTAARTLKEIRDVIRIHNDYYLSKINDDTAEGKIRFNKGIQLGDYQNGFRGGIINQSGDAELKSLKLREWLEVPELRYNRIEIQMGDKWRSPGGGIIESVDTANRIITLKLEPGEYGAISKDDLCMGIFHSMTPSNNAASSTDDSRNNRTIKGFATSYFKVEELLNPQENNSRFRYSLRPLSTNHNKQVHPEPFMHFAVFGNSTNPDRQSSAYETRTYQRFLINMNDWESTQFNVAAQFGDLSNLNALGLSGLTGYSIYLNSVYFTGTIQQMKAPKIENGTWWTWDGEKWVDSEVPATGIAKDGLNIIVVNESLAVPKDSNNYAHTWAEIHIYEGTDELRYVTGTPERGEYTVSLRGYSVTPGTLTVANEDGKIFAKTTPIQGITENSGYIKFIISGRRRDNSPFSLTKTQNILQVDSGVDGTNVEFIYKITTTEVAPLSPNSENTDQYKPNGWELDPIGVSSYYTFEWVSKRSKIGGTWTAFSKPKLWAKYAYDGSDGADGADGADGIDGKNGDYVEYIFTRNNNLNFGVQANTPDSEQRDEHIPDGWTDDPMGVTPTLLYEWVCKRKKTGGSGGTGGIWGDFSIPALWSRYSFDGKDGIDGIDGATGASLYTQYSATGTSWHDNFQAGDIYMRQKVGTNGTWSAAIRIVGEDGADGPYTDYQFAKNTSATSAPTSGWQDAPPALAAGEHLWMRSRRVVPPAAPGAWSTPSRLTGINGAPGKDGVDSITLLLSNESHTFAGSTTSALAGSVTTNVIAYKGSTAITPTSITVGTKPTGMTSSVSGNTITFTVTTSMTSPSGTVPITVVVDGKSIVLNFSYSIAFKGTAGADGKVITLTGATQIIKIADGVRTPNTAFTVVGTASGTTISTWTYSVNGGSFSSTVPTGVSRSGNTVTINPLNVSFTTLSIRASDGSTSDTFTIGVVSDGSQGPPGVGVPIVFRGEYVATNTYYGSTTRQDIVKYSNNYYIAKQTAGSFSGITPPSAGQNNAQWDSFGSSFESVATGLLLAEKANVAGFAFIDQKMISQFGVNAEGTQLNLGVDNTPPAGFIPNLKLDGNLGEITAGAGKIKFNKDGSGYLANNNLRWDDDGNLTINGQLFTGTQTGGLYTNEIKSDGSGRLGGGKIKWHTDGSGYIGSNSEVNGLRWDASGNVYIGRLKITGYGMSIGSTTDSGTWTPNSYNLVMYPEYSLFREVGSNTKFVREASINLDRSFAGIAGKDAVAIYNHLRTTEQGGIWSPGNPPRNLWQTNKALILSARYADINLALNVLNGFVYLNDVRTSGNLNLANKGYVRTTTMNGFKVLILEDTDPPINRDIPGPDGLYWNSEQSAEVTYHGVCEYPNSYKTIHRGIVRDNEVSSTISRADANTKAYNIAYNLAEQDRNQNGGCTDLYNDVHVIYY